MNTLFATALPGDTIFLKRGDVFSGKLVMAKSGSAGDPIVLTAYGEGEKPVVSGLTRLNNFSQQSGKIWSHSLSATPAVVLVNEVQQAVGRKPNRSEAGGGYRFYSAFTATTITSNDLLSDPNWTGGEIVIRKNRWILDRCPILDHTGSVITFQNPSQYIPSKNFGYFIQNHISTLDQDGEWAYDKLQKKLLLYLNSYSASATNVQVSTTDVLLDLIKLQHITLQDIAFTGANETAVNAPYSSFINFKGCEFSYSGLNAIFMNYSTNVNIERCRFENLNNNGITTQWGCANITVHNNYFNGIGLFAGMGKNGDLGYQALTIKGKNNRITDNVIKSTGYIPIRFEGDFVTIENNFIDRFCSVKDDGAAIYTWNNDANAPENTARVVKDNIILNGIGAGAGTSYLNQRNAHGIYLDDNSANVEITGNTVAYCSDAGVYIHNSRKSVIRNNTFFNNDKQLYFQHSNTSPHLPVRSLDVKENILFSNESNRHLIHVRTIKDDVGQFGVSDSNYFNRPFSREPFVFSSYRKNYNEFLQAYDLSSWQGAFGKDRLSKNAPVQFDLYRNNGIVGSNKVLNSTFDRDVYNVYGFYYSGAYDLEWNSGGKLTGGCAQVTLDQSTDNRGWMIMDVGSVQAGKTYILRFSLLGSSNNKSIHTFLRQKGAPYTRITATKYSVVKNTRTENEVYFVAESDQAASLVFDFSDQGTFWLDNIQLHEVNVTQVLRPEDNTRFEYNATQQRKTVALDGTYVDPRNRKYSGSISLEPFTSAVLLREGTVQKGAQSISIDSLPAKKYGDQPFSLTASATSGLPVSYRAVFGPATVTNEKLTITGAGQVLIEAVQNGNEAFYPASPVTFTLTVSKKEQSIAFAALPGRTVGDDPFALQATATSALPVRFRIVSGPASLEGGLVKINGIGEVVVEATQSGNINFLAALPVRQRFMVAESGAGKQSQSIRVTPVADVEVDTAPFSLNAVASSGLPVTYKLLSGPATLAGNVLTVTGIGQVVIEVDQDGSDLYEAAEPVSFHFNVVKASQTITFATLPNKKTSDESFLLKAVASSGLAVQYRVISGPAKVTGNVVELTEDPGVVVLEATQGGNDYYSQAVPVRQSFSVSEVVSAKQNQTIVFGTLAYKTYNSPSFELTANASSGLPVSFRVVSGPVKIAGNIVTITGVGTVVVEARQDGDDEYNSAPAVQRNFTVGKSGQTINFPTIASRQLGSGSLTLEATSSSGLPVSYRVVSGPATVSGDVVSLTGTGLVTIEASQKGNEHYTATFPVYRSFAVTSSGAAEQQQTIEFPPLNDIMFGDEQVELKAEASSGLAVTYEVVSGPAVVEGNILKVTGTGSVVVEASQYGNNVFMAAIPETRSFTVKKAEQAIAFPSLTYQVYGNPSFRITAMATSGLPVYFRVVSGPITINGNQVTITGVGPVVIEANQPGNENYRIARPVQRSFTIGRGSQIITFPHLGNRTLSDETFTLDATSSSGLTVHYKIVSGPAKVVGNAITLTGTGIVVVEASQPGNTFFAPAFSLQRTFTVTPPITNSVTINSNEPTETRIGQLRNKHQNDLATLAPEKNSSIQVWPNPVRSTGIIRITLIEATKADVGIYDNGGRLVKLFAGKTFEAGRMEQLNLPTSDMPAGIYYVRVANGKMLLQHSFQVSR
jgi:parallel beta-helix repeat protein